MKAHLHNRPTQGRKVKDLCNPLDQDLRCRSRCEWDSLTQILRKTWIPSGASLRRLTSVAPVEKAWYQVNQADLGTVIHRAFADVLQGRSLSGYSHRVQSVIQRVAEEGFFDVVQGSPQVEVPLVWVRKDNCVGYTTRLDAHLQLGGVPTLVELTYRPQIVSSLSDLGDKLVQLTGLRAACTFSDLGTKEAVVVVVYPFGRPDFFWIHENDMGLLRNCWTNNLKPRLERYYNAGGSV